MIKFLTFYGVSFSLRIILQTPLEPQQYVICVIIEIIELYVTNLNRSIITDKDTEKK